MTTIVECPNCGNNYESLSIHWSSCGYPELSDYQKELLIGGLMSDASMTMGYNKPRFRIYNTNIEFLKWYRDKLGFLSNEVIISETGEEKHQRNIENGFDVERDADYKDLYLLSTKTHEYNLELYKWYDSGSKQYPDDLELTPTIAKIWYCGDGNINWDQRKRGYCEIGCNNESGNINKIVDMFNRAGFSTTFSNGRIRLHGDSQRFLNWIGSPPNGMEYKWEIYNRSNYESLKQKV